MIEVEIKIRPYVEPGIIKRKLHSIGAQYLFSVKEKDTYYQHPARDFSKTDEALRIRERTLGNISECIIAYKGPRKEVGKIKKREEIEVRVDNCKNMYLLLEKLGFRETAVVVKEREYYRLGNCTISIDNVDKLGLFLEIECSEEEIKNVLSKLNIGYDVVKETYLEMILRHRLSTGVLRK